MQTAKNKPERYIIDIINQKCPEWTDIYRYLNSANFIIFAFTLLCLDIIKLYILSHFKVSRV
jgi:hypothetical protein